MARHPFAWIPGPLRRRAFAAATGLTLATMAGLGATGAALQTEAAPQGIVSFELAGSLAAAERILASWDSSARTRAGLNLGADYLLLVAYASAIGLACALAADALRVRAPRAAALGDALAWGQLAAAGLDAVENAALIGLLLGARSAALPALAAACAVPKFTLVAAGLGYAAAGALAARRGGRA